MRRRIGASLVELMLIMSACSVVLTLTAELIHRALIVQSKATSVFDAERSAQRLSMAFRRDLHDAAEQLPVEPEEGDSVLIRLALPEVRIEYRHDADTIERRVLAGDTVKAREQFVFPQAILASVESQPTDIFVLSVKTPLTAPEVDAAHPTSQSFLTPTPLEVRAILGRNGRRGSAVSAEETQ